ncbi:MAG TPA: DUF397 domain-containing protein [Micromonosporaceae bacterium]
MDKTWRKSTRSGGHDNCVEVRRAVTGEVQVRDSKDPNGPVLSFTPSEWASFIGSAQGGEFDR